MVACDFCEKLFTKPERQILRDPIQFYYHGCKLQRKGNFPWSKPEFNKYGCNRGDKFVFHEQGLFGGNNQTLLAGSQTTRRRRRRSISRRKTKTVRRFLARQRKEYFYGNRTLIRKIKHDQRQTIKIMSWSKQAHVRSCWLYRQIYINRPDSCKW